VVSGSREPLGRRTTMTVEKQSAGYTFVVMDPESYSGW
jgi:hypothetical protein